MELYHRNPDSMESVWNQTALSNSTATKCVPMQVIKQPEHGRASVTEGKKVAPFRRTLINTPPINKTPKVLWTGVSH